MATATLSPLPQEDSHPGGLAKWFLPWLLSTASHLILVLSLALFAENHRGVGKEKLSGSGISLTSIQVVPAAAGGSSASAAQFFSDADSNDTQSAAQPASATSRANDFQVHDKGELTALVEDHPPVELPTLPSIVTEAPSASSQASAASVANASSMLRSEDPHQGQGRGKGTGNVVGDGAGPVGLGETLEKGAARTGVFGVSGVGYKFVYVFDRSGSMDGHGGAPLASAKRELVHSLRELEKTHQFQIIFYNENPRIFAPSGGEGRLAFGTEQNKRLAERFVGGITADGATQHEEALTMALRMRPDVIFFLTDADEPSLSAKQLARIAQQNHGTSINAIEFGYGPQGDSNNFLVRMARQNGGQHVYVDVSQLLQP
jgi:hypothetical protein